LEAGRSHPRRPAWTRIALPARAGALISTTLTGFGIQAVLVVTGVLAARMLGPSARGHLALLALVPMVLVLLGNVGLPMATTYFIAREPRSARATLRMLLRTVSLQTAAITAVHACVLLVILHGQSSDVQLAGAITLATVPAWQANRYRLALAQATADFRLFNAFRVLPLVLYAVGLVALFAGSADTLVPVTAAWVGSLVLAGIVSLFSLARGLPAACDDDLPAPPLRSMFGFGARGFLGENPPLEALRPDQLVVAAFLSPAALGLYVVAQSFSNLSRFVAEGIGQVAFPHLAQIHDAVAARRALWRYFWLTAAVCGAITAVLVAAAGVVVPLFFGDAFDEAVPVSRILIAGALLFALRRMLSAASRGLGYPALGSVAEVIAWVTLIPACAVLAPLLGVDGVAIGVAVSGALALLYLLVALHRARPAPTPDPGSA
jgi:O-antigen/teichoic acid export membrane protein